MTQYLFFVSLIIASSILLIPLSTRFRAPILFVFLVIGMLLGEDGPGGILFEGFSLTHSIGSVCLALILLSGGLDTRFRDVRAAALPAALLAGPGVIVTALVVGVGYSLVLGAPLAEGLLFGAVVSSTDAAATFMSLRSGGIVLDRRPRQTLLVESGINDPMAIFLTITMVEIVDTGAALTWVSLADTLPLLLQQLGLGALIGLAAGWAASTLKNRVRLPSGLASPFILSIGLMAFSGTGVIGGSGFLAVYLFGLVVANHAPVPPTRTIQFHDGLSWIAQICLFVLLGLLVTPSALPELALAGLTLAAILFLVARPAAVAACLMPCRLPLREQGYIAWMGMRGSVPIFLSIFPVISPGPITPSFFNLVFVIVVISLLFHGLTASALARWLGLDRETGEPPTDR
ncbi:potassium/proton antiporter [Maricaulis sp.]|uniref:potassium/proton antiporter n=1 Tax=Maricaulis sp. TaxID=1486257 RepID=UPI0026305E1A|nr:potassium/proton antiporter [Maricaulis sp.]